MGSRLQFDLGKVRDGIFSALGHLLELFEHEAVEIFGGGRGDPER